jgi:hypothetical protein
MEVRRRLSAGRQGAQSHTERSRSVCYLFFGHWTLEFVIWCLVVWLFGALLFGAWCLKFGAWLLLFVICHLVLGYCYLLFVIWCLVTEQSLEFAFLTYLSTS